MSAAIPLLERDISQSVCGFLEASGWRIFRHNVSVVRFRGRIKDTWVAYGEKGMPDWQAIYYLGNYRTLTLWLEFKRPGKGRLSPYQLAWRQLEEKRGAIIWQIDDFDEFRSLYRQTFDYPGSPVKGQRELPIGKQVSLRKHDA